MFSIITMLLPSALKLVGWFVGRSQASAETKKLVLELIKSAQMDSLISKANKDELKKQREEIRQQKKDEENAKKNTP